jgi:N-acetyl-alpha-D-glucosaminyl L-malate synthase BshA
MKRIGIMGLASFGGSARIASQLAVQLARRGHKVHLFTRTDPFGDRNHASELTLHTVKPDREADLHPASLHIDWSSKDIQAFLSRVLDVIATEGLDVLHFHYAVPFAFFAAEVKRRLGWASPLLVGTLHGTDVSIQGRDPVKGPQLARSLRQIDALTTVSNSHARLAADVFGLSARPKVIRNFVDLSKFRPQKPLFHEGGDERLRPKIAHVSNFRPVKDPQSMARIFLRIREQMEAELWLIGDGPEMNAVKSILQQSGFEDDVRYWGLQRNVAPLLAQADLLLMTSLSESFSLAALEAMACGIPVLATEVGGLPEVVIHGETGFLFPLGDHNSAVRLAVNLLSDQTLLRSMRIAAAGRASQYGFEKVVPLYEDFYKQLLYSKPQRTPRVTAARAYPAFV